MWVKFWYQSGRWMKARSRMERYEVALAVAAFGEKYLNESSWNGKMTWSIRLIQSFSLVQPSFPTDKQTNVSSIERVSNCVDVFSLPKDYYSFFVDSMLKCAISSNDSAHFCIVCALVSCVWSQYSLCVLSAWTMRQHEKENLKTKHFKWILTKWCFRKIWNNALESKGNFAHVKWNEMQQQWVKRRKCT